VKEDFTPFTINVHKRSITFLIHIAGHRVVIFFIIRSKSIYFSGIKKNNSTGLMKKKSEKIFSLCVIRWF
jgi:hypothetical protein